MVVGSKKGTSCTVTGRGRTLWSSAAVKYIPAVLLEGVAVLAALLAAWDGGG